MISAVAMVLATVGGLILAALAQSGWPLARRLVAAYVEVFRNTPLLIQIFIVYFGLPQLGVKLSPFLSGLAALVLSAAAYNTEIFRAGLEAVPHGQFEAARSAGLGELQILRYVILPQAVRICFPALGNNLVSLVKNSSLVSTIGMVELMFVANDISFNNFRTFEIYGTAAVMYVVIVLALTRLLRAAEGRPLDRPQCGPGDGLRGLPAGGAADDPALRGAVHDPDQGHLARRHHRGVRADARRPGDDRADVPILRDLPDGGGDLLRDLPPADPLRPARRGAPAPTLKLGRELSVRDSRETPELGEVE